MTTLCGGGTSGPKAGVSETIIFTAGSLSSLLNNKGGYWATLAAPLLGVLAYSATNLCSTDPPAEPTISDAEYTALLQLGPWDVLQDALVKLAAIVTRVVWFDMCECTTPPTPILPSTTLAPPVGVTLPNYGPSGTCPSTRLRQTISETVPSSSYQPWTNITRLVFPGVPILQSVAITGAPAQDCIAVPPHWTGFTGAIDFVAGTPGGTRSVIVLTGLDTARSPAYTILNLGVSSSIAHEDGTGAFNASLMKYVMVNFVAAASATTDLVVDYTLNTVCSATAVGPASDCCTDPAVIALLAQLMQQVNLIQRQNVPFAYVPAAVHAGLTGTGELAVQGLLGALVEITDGLPSVGVEDGTPDETFEVGWITWGNADGFSARERITHEALLSLPSLAGQYTRIGYTLTVGVEVSITELVREP